MDEDVDPTLIPANRTTDHGFVERGWRTLPSVGSALLLRLRRRNLAWSAVVAASVRVVSAAANFAVTATLLRALNTREYGQLAVAFSILALFPFADLGIGSAVVSRLASAHARGQVDEFAGAVRSARRITRGAASVFLLSGVALGIVSIHLSWQLTNLPAVAVLVAGTGLSLLFAADIRVLYGLQRTDLANAASGVAALVALGATVIAATLKLPLAVIAGAWYLQLLLPACYAAWVVRRRFAAFTRPVNARSFSAPLLRSGMAYLGITVLSAAVYETDEVVISAIDGPSLVTQYDVHAKLFGFMFAVLLVATNPLWPAVAAAAGRRDRAWVVRTARKAASVSVAASVIGALVALAVLPIFVSVLSGGKVAANWSLAAAFAVWSIAMTVAACVAAILNGLQLLRVQLIAGLAGFVLNIVLAILLTHPLGAAGPVIGTDVSIGVSVAIEAYALSRVMGGWVGASRVGQGTGGQG